MKGVEMLTDHPQPHWSNQVCVLLHTAVCIKLYSCQREISHESDESVCTSLMCRRMCSWKCVENERMKSRDSVILGCICITGISYLVISLCSMQVTFKHKIMTNCNKWTKTETSLCVLVSTLICWYFHWQKYVICSICKGIFLLYFYFTIAIFTKVVPLRPEKNPVYTYSSQQQIAFAKSVARRTSNYKMPVCMIFLLMYQDHQNVW